MFTFAQNFFNGKQISTETGIRFYTEAGIFILEQNTDVSADVFDHVFWGFHDSIFYV